MIIWDDETDLVHVTVKDPQSPLSSEIPIDMRHLLARQRKHHQRQGKSVWPRAQAIKSRGVIGGVRGFPVEWLSEEMRSQVEKSKADGT